jgi:putative FmdB family regulatory protein
MPLYDYRCPSGHSFEKLVGPMTDAPQPCPHCGQPAPQVPSVPGKFQWGAGGSWN